MNDGVVDESTKIPTVWDAIVLQQDCGKNKFNQFNSGAVIDVQGEATNTCSPLKTIGHHGDTFEKDNFAPDQDSFDFELSEIEIYHIKK